MECRNLTEEGKAAFRKKRPDLLLDEQTVHRPGAHGLLPAAGGACGLEVPCSEFQPRSILDSIRR